MFFKAAPPAVRSNADPYNRTDFLASDVDEIWDAADHVDEQSLAVLIMAIAAGNAWNRINVTTRQIAGSMRRASASA